MTPSWAQFPPWNWDPSRVDCTPGLCNATPAARARRSESNVSEVLSVPDSMLHRLRPTHVAVSTGWKPRDIGCQMQIFANRTGARVVYLGHPVAQQGRVPPLPRRLSCGATLVDRFTPSSELPLWTQPDPVHFN